MTKDGPAEKAGLKVGDKILQVNGHDMTMATQKQAKKKLVKNQRIVRLKVTRNGLAPSEEMASSVPTQQQQQQSLKEYV